MVYKPKVQTSKIENNGAESNKELDNDKKADKKGITET